MESQKEAKEFAYQPDKLAEVSDKVLVDEQLGVQEVEAAQLVWTKRSKICLYIGLGLASYIYSLDGYTSAVWNYRVTSSFGQHSLLSAIGTAQAIIIAIGKVFHGKIADVFGRAWDLTTSLALYVLGFIIIASAQSINAYAGGIIIYALGYTGLQIILQVIIADITTLRYRALVSAGFSTPFLINFYAGSKVAAHFAPTIDFTTVPEYTTLLRWGYGMFAILFPVALAPIIITLFWNQRKAKKQGILTTRRFHGQSWTQKIYSVCSEMDLVGVILLVAALGLILEPIALAGATFGVPTIEWTDAKVLAPCFVIGALCWPVLIYWELYQAKHPYLPLRVMKNRSVIGACLIGFFDFVSFYLQYPYLASFVAVTTDWSAEGQNYFLYTQTLSLTVFAISFGALIVFTQRYKWYLVVGVAIRIIGVGCMIAARNGGGKLAGLVITQIIQGLGGGILSAGGQLAAQASVPHQDVAVATALNLLFAEIGNAVGNSVAGAIWRNTLPNFLRQELTGLLSDTEIETIYGSAIVAASYPMGTPIREGIIRAYVRVMRDLLIAATCLGLPAFIGALIIHDYKADDKQNAVEAKRPDGTIIPGATMEGEVVDPSKLQASANTQHTFMSRFFKRH